VPRLRVINYYVIKIDEEGFSWLYDAKTHI